MWILGQVYVTRKQDEALNKDCLVARFRDYSAYMVWGSISQSGPKEFFVFEKGGVNQDVYIKNIVPLIQKACDSRRGYISPKRLGCTGWRSITYSEG